MKKTLLTVLALGTLLYGADSNASKQTGDLNKSKEKARMEEQVRKQMEKEKKFAKEQTFYQGDEYDLKGAEVDPNSLSTIPKLEPEYDFDMSEGVYSD